MEFFALPFTDTPAWRAVQVAWRCDETAQVQRLLAACQQTEAAGIKIQNTARELVNHVRSKRREGNGIDALMHEYQLSTPEGVVLMCLAKALLRIPDEDTADKLIRDKLTAEDWDSHLGNSESLFVNASTFGLMMSGRMLRAEAALDQNGHQIFSALLQRSTEPLIRNMLRHAMRILGKQFVMGRTIVEALERARELEAAGFRYSYDMLGEAARTRADSERYLQAYLQAIVAIGKAAAGRGVQQAPGISIKLSALHPRYEFAQAEQVLHELYPVLLHLCEAARVLKIGLTIDAEETDRLELSLMLLERLAHEPLLQGWQGLGLAVQAYQKRAFDLIGWLEELALASKRQLMVRLVKGAYWDSEIKRAQEKGLSSYPVFTRKPSTDVSYLACARRLLATPACFYPQFATHNAHTVASIVELASSAGVADFEFQRLHGMGTALYDKVLADTGIACRIYAPVGSHEDLLPYLVRRLLENGANSSFVNRIADDQTPVESIIVDPRQQLASLTNIPHPRIPLPPRLFPDRINAAGLELVDGTVLHSLQQQMQEASRQNRE